MKANFKKISIIIVFLFIFIGIQGKSIYAYESEGVRINVNINGERSHEFKTGDDVTIKIKLKNLTDLFAGSVKYTYDNTILEVTSIDVNEKIESSGVYAPYKDTAKDGNIARYCFTLLGNQPAFNGDLDFITIHGKAKKDGQIKAGADNITFNLVQRVGDDMQEINYDFRDSEGNVYEVSKNEGSKDNNKTENSSSNSNGQANGKEDVKVQLVEKAEDNDEELDEEENENNSESVNKEETDKKDKEDNSLKTVTTDNDTSDDEKEEKEEKNNTAIIAAVVIILLIAMSGIAFKIIKNKRK